MLLSLEVSQHQNSLADQAVAHRFVEVVGQQKALLAEDPCRPAPVFEDVGLADEGVLETDKNALEKIEYAYRGLESYPEQHLRHPKHHALEVHLVARILCGYLADACHRVQNSSGLGPRNLPWPNSRSPNISP